MSVRSLFYSESFYPDLELSQVNGTLFPRKSSLTSTLLSRLNLLWRHISKSRTHFETKPDTGKLFINIYSITIITFLLNYSFINIFRIYW